MNIGTWFEIPVNDLQRAKKFYEKITGLTLVHIDMGESVMEMFPAEPTVTGCGGALIVTEGYTPSYSGTVIYFATTDIDGTLKKVNAEGGKTIVPKMSIGEFGAIGQFEDTEGNRIGLHSQS